MLSKTGAVRGAALAVLIAATVVVVQYKLRPADGTPPGETTSRRPQPGFATIAAPPAAPPVPDSAGNRSQADTLSEEARRISGQLNASQNAAEDCLRLRDSLGQFLAAARPRPELWAWGMTVVDACAPLLSVDDGSRLQFLSGLTDVLPDAPEILVRLGDTEFGSGKPNEGIGHLERAAALDPSASNRYLLAKSKISHAAILQFSDKKSESALGLYAAGEQELKAANANGAFDKDPQYWIARAEANIGQGDLNDAIASADRALFSIREGGNADKDEGRTALTYFKVGTLRFKAGDRETGIAYMNQGISRARATPLAKQLELEKRFLVSGDIQTFARSLQE